MELSLSLNNQAVCRADQLEMKINNNSSVSLVLLCGSLWGGSASASVTDVHYKQEMETLFVSPEKEKIALEVFAMYLYNDEWFFSFPGVISHLGWCYHLSNLEEPQ